MDFADFLSVIRKWKFLIIVVVLAVTGYVLVTTSRSKDKFTATVNVIPGLSQITNSSPMGINIEQAGDRISATYAQLATTQAVLENALSNAKVNMQPAQLRGEISTSQPANTPIISIEVTDYNPNRAQTLANAVGDALVQYAKDSAKQGDDAAKTALTNELSDIEKQYSVVKPGGSNPDANLAQALADRRDSVLKNYDTILTQQTVSADIEVAGHADTYGVIGNQATQKTLIALIVSFAIGVALAFIIEGIRKAIT